MPLSPETLSKAWKDFKVFKSPEARADLINHYSYLVKITAGRLVTSLPGGLDREDLVGAGVAFAEHAQVEVGAVAGVIDGEHFDALAASDVIAGAGDDGVDRRAGLLGG